MPAARLILEDGTVYEGESFGSTENAIGEVVFNTSLTGYQEIATDPSYRFQIVTMTHPLLGLALGGKTYKLKFGHRGGNHPVKDLRNGRVEITAQNHGFAVDPDSLKDSDVEFSILWIWS